MVWGGLYLLSGSTLGFKGKTGNTDKAKVDLRKDRLELEGMFKIKKTDLTLSKKGNVRLENGH